MNHLESYVQGRVHTNGLENSWSLLKRILKGSYVSVDPADVQAYVDDRAYRSLTERILRSAPVKRSNSDGWSLAGSEFILRDICA